MNIHFVRRLIVDRDADGADVGRGVANCQFRCRGKLGKFDSVTGLAQCDRGFSRSAAISYLRRAADARGFLRLEGAGFGCDRGNGSEKQNAGRDSHETYVVGQFGMHETMLPTWWQHVYIVCVVKSVSVGQQYRVSQGGGAATDRGDGITDRTHRASIPPTPEMRLSNKPKTKITARHRSRRRARRRFQRRWSSHF